MFDTLPVSYTHLDVYKRQCVICAIILKRIFIKYYFLYTTEP